MARKCSLCGKKSKMVWRRVRLRAGKYNPTVKRRQYPNLQWVRLLSGGQRDKSLLPPSLRSGERVLACTKCIKALGKRK